MFIKPCSGIGKHWSNKLQWHLTYGSLYTSKALYKDMLFWILPYPPGITDDPIPITLYIIDYPVLISIASLRKRIQVFKNNNHIKFSHETLQRSHNYPPQHDTPHFNTILHFHYKNYCTFRSRRNSENSKTWFWDLSRYGLTYEVIFHMKQNQVLMGAGALHKTQMSSRQFLHFQAIGIVGKT